MTHLTEDQLHTLRELLDEREAALKSDVGEHVAQFRDSIEPDPAALPGDVADQAEAGMVRDNENAAVGRNMRELRDIEAARERIDRAEAGICIDCGVEIPFARLRAQPTATRCIRCQELYERTHAPAENPGSA